MRKLVHTLILLGVCVQIGGCAVTGLATGWWGATGGGGAFGNANTGTIGAVPPYGIPFDAWGDP